MPNLITPPELAEAMANWLGVYGHHGIRCGEKASLKDCECRVCFVADLTSQIRESVKNETLLRGGEGAEASAVKLADPICDGCHIPMSKTPEGWECFYPECCAPQKLAKPVKPEGES